jgi:hypothetical protein
MNNDFAACVARLSGYLSGVVAMDGDIRQYTAEAFAVSAKESSDSPEAKIHSYYAAQIDLQFSSSKKLERGLRDLEHQLGAYLIRRSSGLVEHSIEQQLVDARRAFLAFRTMDMIDDIAPEARDLHTVYKLETSGSDASSLVTFFAVRIDPGLLVLQFNDRSVSIGAGHSKR